MLKLRTSFRGKLLLLSLVPLALAQLVTMMAVMRTVERDVNNRAHESLRIGIAVVDEYLAGRGDQLRTSVEVMAADFGLKEAVATADEETIRSVLQNHSLRVAADIALIIDRDGRAVASTLSPEKQALLVDRVPTGDQESWAPTQSTLLINETVYQAFAVPLRSPTPIGWVVLGFHIDATVTDRIASLTGHDVALVANADGTHFLAGSDAAHSAFRSPANLAARTETRDEVYIVNGPDTDYLATSTAFVASRTNDARVHVILLRSITDAMEPYLQARRGLAIFGIALLIVVAVSGAWLSASVARPLNTLSKAARDMMEGNYDASVTVRSDDEVGELASTFNAMRKAIADRERRISHRALHDPLTDLPNQSNILQTLESLLEQAGRDGRKVFVLSIRLSRMSAISSTLGHSAGDELIRLAARHLRNNIEPREVLGHLGGDQFILIIPDAESDGALECAEKIRDILAAGVTLEKVNISLQSEIGIAGYPEHSDGATSLLRNAAIACSEAHTHGESVTIFMRGREYDYVRQLRIVNDLRGAFHRAEVQVWYQPKVALPEGIPSGAEALVRWEHPEYGWLAPDEFVPAAEEAGTIVHLTRYVLKQAIADCRNWNSAGHSLQVSVNLSARDLCDDYLPYYVLQLLKEHHLEPQRLTLEVTENSVIQQLRRAITVLECLQDIGVCISMDDFGTGQSSLAQLKNIPLNELKIDKSFVTDLAEDKDNEAIVKTTIELAHSLGIHVVAEGVEDEYSMRFLSSVGCEQAQGYYLSKPIPLQDFMRWLSSYRSAAVADRRAKQRPFRQNG
jgi:diguanylate cyclase (GGDEF)-like protein